MRKIILLVLFILLYTDTYSQTNIKRLNSSAFIDLTANSGVLYTFYNPDKIQETSLREKGAFELVYNLDYNFVKRLSVGVNASYAHFIDPKFSSIKTGAGFKYYYIQDKSYFLTLQYGYHIPFKRDNFREGHQIKIGQYFDVTKVFKDSRLLLGLFYNYDFFYLDGAKPLLSVGNKPSSLKYNSYGISIGVKF